MIKKFHFPVRCPLYPLKKSLDILIDVLDEIATFFGDEKISIEYNPSTTYKNIEQDFNKSLDLDISSKLTNKGPHRDDMKFIIDSNKSNYASQGQVRTIALALKLTLINIIKKYKKNNPIVLLDDVLSELDDNRKNKLFELLDDNYQIFISTTELNNIRNDLLEKAQIIKLIKK